VLRKELFGMGRKRYTPEQIIGKLREGEVLLGKGQAVGEACRKLGVTEQTYYRWRSGQGGSNGRPETVECRRQDRHGKRDAIYASCDVHDGSALTRRAAMRPRKSAKEKLGEVRDARSMIVDIQRKDANEAETRRRVERIFERVMGYDALTHLSRERAVHGAGDTEHVDFAVEVDDNPDAPPAVMVELKRVGLDLSPKHLKQASRYAIDSGCEWVLLTNGREWGLYHVEFGQPPQTKLVQQWDLLKDEPEVLVDKFQLLSYRNLKRNGLAGLWERTEALAPKRLLTAILSPEALNAVRRVIRRETGVGVKPDQVVTALRRMLNEASGAMLEDIEVSLPPEKKGRRAGEAKKPLADRRHVKQRFWTGLLERAKAKTKLHANVSPRKGNYASASAGKAGLWLSYVIREHDAGVDLYIDTGGMAENKAIFDKLMASADAAEAAFGGELEWQRLEEKRACRVKKQISTGGYRDEQMWPEIQDAMIDAMVRLEKALRPHI